MSDTVNSTITSIKASSRASVKVRDSYYTVEYTEERALKPDLSVEEVEDEREKLWNTVNNECDSQVQEILKTFDTRK